MLMAAKVLIAMIADGLTFGKMDIAVTTAHHIFYWLWGCCIKVFFRPQVSDYPINQ